MHFTPTQDFTKCDERLLELFSRYCRRSDGHLLLFPRAPSPYFRLSAIRLMRRRRAATAPAAVYYARARLAEMAEKAV